MASIYAGRFGHRNYRMHALSPEASIFYSDILDWHYAGNIVRDTYSSHS